jgi:hypothetical protein
MDESLAKTSADHYSSLNGEDLTEVMGEDDN